MQGKSDFEVFNILRRLEVHHCHVLHYLQMATEMLGKAHVWNSGPPTKLSHSGFARFLRSLRTNHAAQALLGYEGRNEHWQNLIRKSIPLAQDIEKLAPKLAGVGPNPEYPWPPSMPTIAPVEHEFRLWTDLQDDAGRRFLSLVSQLFQRADAFL